MSYVRWKREEGRWGWMEEGKREDGRGKMEDVGFDVRWKMEEGRVGNKYLYDSGEKQSHHNTFSLINDNGIPLFCAANNT